MFKMDIGLMLILSLITYVSSIKLGSYNTYQIVTNTLAPTLKDPQIQQIGDSDIDVLCLQELATMKDVVEYTTALAGVGYTNTFSQLNVQSEYSPQNLITPRIPCEQSQIDALNSVCAQKCQQFYGQVIYAECMALNCSSDFDQILYSECNGCFALYPGIQPFVSSIPIYTLDFDGAAAFCLNPPDLSEFPGGVNFQENLYNFTEGAVIITRTDYPIRNTWSFILPSWLFVERRLHIAEIDICAETDPNNADCKDRIIVGCTHLESIHYTYDTNVVQSPRLNEPDITSHIGLNRLQTQFIIDNVYNDNILSILGRDEDADNIFGVFLMGDTNNGQLFSRCEYLDDEGNTNADNCKLPEDIPLNPYDIFAQNDLINGRDIIYNAKPNEGIKCTSCIDPADDDFNVLLLLDDSGIDFLTDPETSSDLDHIFVQNGYCQNLKRVKSAREFMDKIVELPGELECPTPTGSGLCVQNCSLDGDCPDDQLCCSNGCGHDCMDGVEGETEFVPSSDHYAVTLDIEFKCNRGGRHTEHKCLRDGRKGKKRSRRP